jgi:hypothetical protein
MPAAERQLTDLNIVDQLLQMIPWPVEPSKLRTQGAWSILARRFTATIHGAAHLPPPAATGAPGTQMIHDVPQRVQGLHDVVGGAEQGGIPVTAIWASSAPTARP